MAKKSLSHLYSCESLSAQPSAIRDICALVSQPEIRSLAGGWPDAAEFPLEEIGRIFEALMAEHGGQMFQYGSTEGLRDLRLELARRMRNEGLLKAKADDLLITHGSAQGMQLAAQVFVDRGDVVMAGLPTYFGGPGAVRARGGKVVGVPVDRQGLDTTALKQEVKRLKTAGERVKGVYVIPNFQNPTGVTLSLKRRRRLIQLADEFDLIIFEDDPYGELRFEGRHLPSLKSLDDKGRVVHLRSLSKTFVPGMRLGWVYAAKGAVRKMVVAKQFADAATNTPSQYILLEFIRQGLLDRQIKRNISYYRTKRDFMLEQMKRHFPAAATWNKPQGGFFIFVYLPTGMDAADLFRRAVERKVAFVTGQSFFVDGGGRHTFRLSYAQADNKDIQFAVRVLGKLIKQNLPRRNIEKAA
ncbi:Transcriptional regulator, GntR family domain / Aspartate aminotransferase (EC [Olavius algarvensis Delta 1 endosymbiont]|nr:Transcriptional regulator, GntR family domain / Aspartate aminotransferase (EC [Olavius algarvensis Delta 1 endosymbiont]